MTEVELELIAKLVPYLWNEDEDKIFAVICEDKPGLLLEVHYADGVVPGSLEVSLLKLADEFPPRSNCGSPKAIASPTGATRGQAFIPIEIANVDYADKVYKRFKF